MRQGRKAINSETPILIFGAPRSGTSLLSRLIDAHSRISIPFESHLFNQWLPRLESYGDLSDPARQKRLVSDIVRLGVVRDWSPRPTPEDVARHVTGPGFGAVAHAVMEWAARTAGKPRWGEKTPQHTMLHDEVLSTWPKAQVIMIERDPRAVAMSWKQARFHGNHVLPFAKSWVRHSQALDAVERKLPPHQRIRVSYEALVRDPETELRRLMDFLGEDFEAQQLEFHRKDSSYDTDQRNLKRLKTPVSADSIDRWKSGLSKYEIRLVETICGETMAQRGYDPSPIGAKPVSEARLSFARRVEVPAQRVAGAFKNLKGFVYLSRDLQWTVEQLLSGVFPEL